MPTRIGSGSIGGSDDVGSRRADQALDGQAKPACAALTRFVVTDADLDQGFVQLEFATVDVDDITDRRPPIHTGSEKIGGDA
jgi:hypothetical protein